MLPDKMTYEQLVGLVLSLQGELARLKRMYEDLFYNLDDDNFSDYIKREKERMKTEIKVNADGVSVVTREVFPNGSENESSISINSREILNRVTASDLEAELTNYSTISQTAEAISMKVGTIFDGAVTLSFKPTAGNTTAAEKKKLVYCTAAGSKGYYYWNDVTYQWVKSDSKSIYSAFEQTASGFKLTGDVSVSGDLISGGTITGADIVGRKFWDSSKNGYLTVNAQSGFSDLVLCHYDGKEVFKIYDLANGAAELSIYGNRVLTSSKSGGCKPQGTWNFANAVVTGLDAIAKFA